jgi:hypothetical protein
MALTTINSGGVKDDSIVNADIKSDAAIAGTKVAPDFGSQNIATTGNAGIGTASPDTLLHVEATNTSVAVNNAIRISDADTAVVSNQVCGRIEFETADTGNPGVNCQIDNIYSGNGGGGELQIRTGFAGSLVDAVRIDDTGKVGIGVTPTTALHVKETAQADVAIFECSHSSTWGSQISLKHNTSSAADDDMVGSLSFDGKDDAGNNTTYAQIRSYATDVSNNAEDGVITFHTRNHSAFGERMRLTNDGNLSLGAGNLVVANGHGIDFSASEGGHSTGTHASILDDYETGNFNPGISFGYGTTNLSLGTAIGSYTKIGRRVFIDFVINFSAVGDSTGYARLTALPFTASSDSRVRVHGFCSYYANMQSLTGRPTFNNSGGATTAVMYDDGTGTNTTLNETNFANNSLIRGKLEYTCA